MSEQSEALDHLREVRAEAGRWSHLRQPDKAAQAELWASSGDRALWALLDALDAVLATHGTVTAPDGTLLPLPDDLTVRRYGYAMFGHNHGTLTRHDLVSIAGQAAHDASTGQDPYRVGKR